MITKKAYTKPSLKRVAWDVNKSICNSVIMQSFGKCIKIDKGTNVNLTEIRSDQTGTWNRVGSVSSESW